MIDQARRLAYAALMRVDHEGAYANLLLPRMLDESRLADRDRRFVTDLVYGSVRMRRACDHLVDRFVMKDPDPPLRTLLRLGAYQIAYCRTPAHAAVSTTVALAPNRARGFVNAVLRRVADAPVEFPDVATRLSYPDWIVQRVRAELGDVDGLAALERMNDPPPVSERRDSYVQDLASQWVAGLVDAAPGERVADLCAAPGGKATAIVGRTGATVVALDRRLHRVQLMVANRDRLGQRDRLAVVAADATRAPLCERAFDHVLVDAPCSGLGALRRRPDARWRIAEADLAALTALQDALLREAGRLARPGGTVTYSVCTLTAAESIDHDRPQWASLPQPGSPWRPYGRGVRLLPQDADTDGMAVMRWRLP
ncbi:MAG: transcription antitermination factor NusB [Acidimicrobiales bacterium]